MKKLLILLGLSLLISFGSYAQKNKRTSAYMYNKNKTGILVAIGIGTIALIVIIWLTNFSITP